MTTEGFNPDEVPVRRGRRDPQLAAAMLDDDDQLADAGTPNDQTYIGLSAGDTVFGKITRAGRNTAGEVWTTFGAQAQVLEGETFPDTFARVAEVIVDGVSALEANNNEAQAAQLADQREEARTRRIPQRQYE
jgi:hypothetical protein